MLTVTIEGPSLTCAHIVGSTISTVYCDSNTSVSQQEQELKETIFAMEAKLFGLTRDDVRKLVFELCETKTQQNSQTRRKGLAKVTRVDTQISLYESRRPRPFSERFTSTERK